MRAELALGGSPDDGGLGRAVGLAIALHLLLAVLLWLSSYISWDREALNAAGLPVMNADLDVSASEASAVQEALEYVPEPMPEPVPEPVPEPQPQEAVPPPQPLPEPIPEEAPVERQQQAQERVPVPDDVQQREARLDAMSEEAAQREQEEKRRQEQIDLTERERQREAEQQQRLAKQQEREKKLAEIRAEREKLQKEMDMREQRLKQLADARAQRASETATTGSPPAGNGGVDNDLLNAYIAAIQAAVTSKWTRPDNMPNLPCKMRITQLPGGEVMSVDFDASCPYDEAGKRSVEAAVLKAQPLPYAGFDSVFSRRLNFTFRPN